MRLWFVIIVTLVVACKVRQSPSTGLTSSQLATWYDRCLQTGPDPAFSIGVLGREFKPLVSVTASIPEKCAAYRAALSDRHLNLDMQGAQPAFWDLVSSLTQVESLTIRSMKVADVVRLTPLARLTELRISGSYLQPDAVDWDSAVFARLRVFSLDSCEANGRRVPVPLGRMRSLKDVEDLTVRCADLEIGDDVLDFGRLSKVDFGRSAIKSLVPFMSLGNLTSLDLSEAKVDDISALGQLVGLKELVWNKGQLASIEALRPLKRLEIVRLKFNRIQDITPLADNKELRFLDVSNNQLADAWTVRNFAKLEHLDLSVNKLASFGFLDGLTELRTVRLRYQARATPSLSSLESATKLGHLDVSHTGVSDIGPIAGATGLKELWVVGCPLRSRSATRAALDRLTNLVELMTDDRFIENDEWFNRTVCPSWVTRCYAPDLAME